jgi:hypothetical protein
MRWSLWIVGTLVAWSCSAEDSSPAATTTTGGAAGAGATTASGASTSSGTGGDLGLGGAEAGAPLEGEVYGHDARQLYKLEPISKEVIVVGSFDCVTIIVPGLGEGMWDIALDKDGNMMGTVGKFQGLNPSGALVAIDKTTASCSEIAQGLFPNSLTFVPAGTLDPTQEVLVGFNGAQYVRIDGSTGAQTPIGGLNPNPTGQQWESSGDVVSIIDDKTYLTVKPLGSGSAYSGPDHIVEVDPITGQALSVIGDTGYPRLWGLGYWGGTAYGFSDTGDLVAIDLTDGTATLIAIPNAPADLAWWGAGVTTAAPIELPR